MEICIKFQIKPPPKGVIGPWYETNIGGVKISSKTPRERIDNLLDVVNHTPKPTPENILNNNGYINSQGYFVDRYDNVYKMLGYAGDYFARQGHEVVYDKNGTAYTRINGKDYYAPSYSVDNFSYTKSFLINAVSEKINFIPEQLVKEGAIKNSIVKSTTKVGGIPTVYFLGSAIKEDVDSFKGVNLVEAIGTDAILTVGSGRAGAFLFVKAIDVIPVPPEYKIPLKVISGILGSILGGIGGDKGSEHIKKNYIK